MPRPAARHYTTVITREVLPDFEAEIVVAWVLHPGDPGRYSGRPEDCYPAEPDEVEVLSAVWEVNDCPVELTGEEEESLLDRGGIEDEPDYDYEPNYDYAAEEEAIRRAEDAYERMIYGE